MKRILLLFTLLGLGASSPAQWVSQNAGFTNKTLGFFEMSVVDKDIVWAICYDGVGGLFGPAHVLDFTRTTNGGTTWTPGKMGSDSSLAFSNICALSGDEAWVAMHRFDLSTGGGIFHTTDGGATWAQSGAGSIFDSSSFPNFVYFKDQLHGIAGGDANGGYFEIYTTTDGGNSWMRTPQSAIPAFVNGGGYGWFDGFCVLGDTVWFGTAKGEMYKSTDFGQTWSVSTVSPQGYAVYEIAFLDDGLRGLSHLRNGSVTMLFSTDDGGLTWTQLPTHPWKQSKITAIPGTGRFMSTSVVSNSPGSAYSDDHGLTWVVVDMKAKAACRFFDSTTGWGAGYFNDKPGLQMSGGIYKWDTTTLSVADPGIGELYKVYPNPAGDKINISYPQTAGMQQLLIYNAIGSLVKMVDHATTQPVDIAGLPGGMYFIRSGTDAKLNLKFIKAGQ
ncbi:MAG: T9SS type A sorting domain-containing protein [Sphingobacteriales bacterium]|nr:MAG: T9SS type A sorting domain-containing protein [Sphingobacteriales bacterium]